MNLALPIWLLCYCHSQLAASLPLFGITVAIANHCPPDPLITSQHLARLMYLVDGYILC